jgi:hypothetical protein
MSLSICCKEQKLLEEKFGLNQDEIYHSNRFDTQLVVIQHNYSNANH